MVQFNDFPYPHWGLVLCGHRRHRHRHRRRPSSYEEFTTHFTTTQTMVFNISVCRGRWGKTLSKQDCVLGKTVTALKLFSISLNNMGVVVIVVSHTGTPCLHEPERARLGTSMGTCLEGCTHRTSLRAPQFLHILNETAWGGAQALQESRERVLW